ncbi:hypothetical protein GYO_1053 [Bacillus spizizenii TU-B-10]|uniref:Uncharacterized protein n=1 Tax=Bacillus spizizenii (strain DSM 15029 / JCM 12233 / NBRC 101239 / NRRL B-23049 / TU-B-10) TaxID=1052585 RepID=G4NUE5_BACS4|nr:hypothetical protein GYO_1053 [Bacillus spizizenii TU-B-10]
MFGRLFLPVVKIKFMTHVLRKIGFGAMIKKTRRVSGQSHLFTK